MVMTDRTIQSSTFEADCLAILDQVAQSNVSVVATKGGQPVARVVPMDSGPTADDLIGGVTLKPEDDEAYQTTGAIWGREAGPR